MPGRRGGKAGAQDAGVLCTCMVLHYSGPRLRVVLWGWDQVACDSGGGLLNLLRSIAVLVLELAMAAPDLAFAWVLKCVAAGVLSQWEAGNPILSRAVVVFQHPHQWHRYPCPHQ